MLGFIGRNWLREVSQRKNICPSLGKCRNEWLWFCIKMNSCSTLCCSGVAGISCQTSLLSPYVSQLSFRINDYWQLCFMSRVSKRSERKSMRVRKHCVWVSFHITSYIFPIALSFPCLISAPHSKLPCISPWNVFLHPHPYFFLGLPICLLETLSDLILLPSCWLSFLPNFSAFFFQSQLCSVNILLSVHW